MDHLIEVKSLSKHFGPLQAVRDVSFTVARGEVLGFLGPNGAGKSTTMKMITGYLEPNSGTAIIAGCDVLEQPIRAKQRIGYLPEGAPGYGEMTVRGFLDFIADVRGLRGAERESRIRDVVAKVHLESVLAQTIETLSKGFRRRVGIAQAILHDPDILIMDEPTDGLDPNQKHEVRTLIRNMAARKAIVISTHILEEVDAVCTRAIIIAAGRILFDGTPDELAARSRMHNAVSLTLKTEDANDAQAALAKLPGIAAVDRVAEYGGTVTFLITPVDGRAILGAVSRAVHAQNWEVAGMRVENGRLDDVFRNITLPHQSETGEVAAE
jgi:ABC-2 type transport system ATP-binding protein